MWQFRSLSFRRVAVLVVTLGPLVFVPRCFDLDSLSSGSGKDAAADGEGMAAKDFSISVMPSYVALAPGQAQTITVSVQRFGTFTGVVNVALSLPPYVNPPSIATFISGASTTFTLTSAVAAPPALAQNNALGDFPLTVAGLSGNETATAPLKVHLSGVLATFDTPGNVPFTIAANVPLIRVKAWGAGGNSPKPTCSPNCAGSSIASGGGGGGGFVLADVAVTPNEMLAVIVGAAGYGGGYSAVQRATSTLVVAGGGGGGGTWYQNADCSSGAGGAGGGPKGQDGTQGQGVMGCSSPGLGGGGATQTADGVDSGGGLFTGLGGGGIHTGGAGGPPNCMGIGLGEPGGGGGGSGGTGVYDAGINVMSNNTGTGTAPANTTDLDYGDAGAGSGAPSCKGSNNSACAPGKAGRIVILVP